MLDGTLQSQEPTKKRRVNGPIQLSDRLISTPYGEVEISIFEWRLGRVYYMSRYKGGITKRVWLCPYEILEGKHDDIKRRFCPAVYIRLLAKAQRMVTLLQRVNNSDGG